MAGPTIAERIIDAIRFGPLDDDVLAKRLGVSQRQSINQVARRLEKQGSLRRLTGPDGKIVNALPDHTTPAPPQLLPTRAARGNEAAVLTEDEVKRAVVDELELAGFATQVAWGKTRGIDIDASHVDGRRYVIEAKVEVRSDQQQGSYFLGALGELLQRMDTDGPTYALALPSNRRYRGLVFRLPALVWTRLNFAVFWVTREQDGSLRVALMEEPPKRREAQYRFPIGPIHEDEMF